jgi:Lipase (class 3)
MAIEKIDAYLCDAAAEAYGGVATSAGAGHVQAVVSERDGLQVIALCAGEPQDLVEWFADFAGSEHELRNHPKFGRCHAGFLTAAEAIFPEVTRTVEIGKPFAVTGHSLGGGIAIGLSALLADAGLPPARLTTFGAPRFDVGATGELLKEIPGERFLNGADPVPDVPAWPLVTDRPWNEIGRHSRTRILDHRMNRYRSAIEAAL